MPNNLLIINAWWSIKISFYSDITITWEIMKKNKSVYGERYVTKERKTIFTNEYAFVQ